MPTLASMMVKIGADIAEFETANSKMQSVLGRTQGIVDQFGRTAQSADKPIQNMSDHIEKTAGRSNALERQFGKLTSGTDFLASGVMRFRRVLEGVVWGTVIGAVAALTLKIIENAKAWFDASTRLAQYKARMEELKAEHDDVVVALESEREEIFSQIIARTKLFNLQEDMAGLFGATIGQRDIEAEKLKTLYDRYNNLTALIEKFKKIQEEIPQNKAMEDYDAHVKVFIEHGKVQEVMGWNIVNAYQAEQEELRKTAEGLRELTAQMNEFEEAINVPTMLGESLTFMDLLIVRFDDFAKQLPTMNQSMIDQMIWDVQRFSNAFGQAIGQWLIYGENFKDSMIQFFRQWAAQSIAQIIAIQTQLLILRAMGYFGPVESSAVPIGVNSPGTYHQGGMVGLEKIPRFHSGLGPDEFLSVLKRGEAVFTPGQLEALGEVMGQTHIQQKIQFIIPAIDGASVERMLRAQRGTIQDIIGDAVRHNRGFARELNA